MIKVINLISLIVAPLVVQMTHTPSLQPVIYVGAAIGIVVIGVAIWYSRREMGETEETTAAAEPSLARK
jgi:threonine/homoserine/homoserine lactone efflux protein